MRIPEGVCKYGVVRKPYEVFIHKRNYWQLFTKAMIKKIVNILEKRIHILSSPLPLYNEVVCNIPEENIHFRPKSVLLVIEQNFIRIVCEASRLKLVNIILQNFNSSTRGKIRKLESIRKSSIDKRGALRGT